MGNSASRVIRLVCVAALLSVAACSGVNTYSTGEPKSNVDMSRIDKDKGLASDLVITATQILRRGNSKVAQVTIRNEGTLSRKFLVRFAWFDADGVNADREREWEPYELLPGETRDVSQSGPPSAVNFRMSIKAG